MEVKIKVKLQPPMMPNFINYETPPRPRQEGFNKRQGISVSDLTRQQALEYAELMKQTFISHWANKQTKSKK